MWVALSDSVRDTEISCVLSFFREVAAFLCHDYTTNRITDSRNLKWPSPLSRASFQYRNTGNQEDLDREKTGDHSVLVCMYVCLHCIIRNSAICQYRNKYTVFVLQCSDKHYPWPFSCLVQLCTFDSVAFFIEMPWITSGCLRNCHRESDYKQSHDEKSFININSTFYITIHHFFGS